MIISLNYFYLNSAATNSRKLAEELNQYSNELNKKVQKKIYSVTGGMSAALSNADYYVDAKIRQLRAKEANARILYSKITSLCETAKNVDNDVAKMIKQNQKELFDRVPDLKPSGFIAGLISFWCDCKDWPLIGWIFSAKEVIYKAGEELGRSLAYWYKCEGGKEIVGIILSFVTVALSGVILACAVLATGGTILAVIAGVAAAISAVIGVVNAITNVVTSWQAYGAAASGHPGIAQIYSGQDKLSDVLRYTNYRDRDKNRNSNAIAAGIDITDAICKTISLVYGFGKSISAFAKSDMFDLLKKHDFSSFGAEVWDGIKSLKNNFRWSDFLSGDLNVKQLKNLNDMDSLTRMKNLGAFNKAIKGLVGDLDKINEGDMKLWELLGKRLFVGVDSAIFSQQENSLGISDEGSSEFIAKMPPNVLEHWNVMKDGPFGHWYNTFEDTELTRLINVGRDFIDTIGIAKLANDFIGSDTLDNLFDFDGGVITEGKNIFKSIFDLFDRYNFTNLDLQGNISANFINPPYLNNELVTIIPSRSTNKWFVVPNLNLDFFNLRVKMPFICA